MRAYGSARVAWGQWLVGLLVLVEVLATAADLLFGPHARVHWEEHINARAGLLLTCGHFQDIYDLKYQTFCGGCTAEALMAMGIFEAWRPTVLAWKLIPASFHIGLVAAGAALSWRIGRMRGSVLFMILMFGQPEMFRKLALTGWGNHAESMFFPLAAAWLLVRRSPQPPSTLATGAAGLLAGLGLWFCHTSGHAIPALLVLTLCLARGRYLEKLALVVTAGVVGFLPWVAYNLVHPSPPISGITRTADLGFAPPSDLMLRWLGGSTVRDALWPTLTSGQEWQGFDDAYWLGLWMLALMGLIHTIVGRSRSRGRATCRSDRRWPARLYGSLALLGLMAGYVYRWDLWRQSTTYADFFPLRYLSPLFPVLVLCVVGTQGGSATGGAKRAWRALVLLLATALGIGGIALRMEEWGPFQRQLPDLAVATVEQHNGPALFGNDPTKLEEHLRADVHEPTACRQDHLFYLGRVLCDERVEGDYTALPLGPALELAHNYPEQRALITGCASRLRNALAGRGRKTCDWTGLNTITENSLTTLGGPGRHALEEELSRALFGAGGPICLYGARPNEVRDWRAPSRAGLCRQKGEMHGRRLTRAMRGDTSGGPVPAELPEEDPCSTEPSFAMGVAWAWGRDFGCDVQARALLVDQLAWGQEAALLTLDESCQTHRLTE